jgi:enoyl-CoA hydratase/carnithine racemase
LLGRQTDRQIGRQADRQTETDRQTDRHVDNTHPIYLLLIINICLQASEVLLYGRKLSAVEANNWGLTSDVIPHSNFRDEVNKRSKHLASLPPEVC